jgi:hypothetical protein
VSASQGESTAFGWRRWLGVGVGAAAVGAVTVFAVAQAVGENLGPDFFINRAGAQIALRGESPYDLAKVRAAVADQFPGDPTLINNCGFFLPPQAFLVFAPFAALPYPAAKVAWAVGLGLSAAAVLTVLCILGTRWPRSLPGQLLPAVLLLNYLTLAVVELGQTSLLFAGCVAAGQWCFERRRPAAGTLLWAIPFVKPHLALPLLPLAWYLGGWRRAAGVVAVVGVLTVAGCAAAGRSPLLLRDYLDYLGSAHKAVMFNQAEVNPEILSWNRLLYASTEWFAGQRLLVELTAATTLAGLMVWFGLAAGRCALAGGRPSAAWAAAAAAAGGLLCAQVLVYDLMLLTLAVPWVRELLAGGWRVRGWLAAGLLALETVPLDAALLIDWGNHRPLGVALLAAVVLVGPVAPRREGP